MPITNIRGRQILDGDISRVDLNATTSSSAVIRKLLPSADAAITLTSTGPDVGTGDVTLVMSKASTTQLGAVIASTGLSIDASGNLSISTSYLTSGTGTANYVPRWTSSNVFGNSIIYDSGTAVGISVSSPAYKLEVNGDINLLGGSFRINGVAIGTGGVTGSGTANYLPKWSSATVLTNSSITDSGTSVSVFTAPAVSYVFNVKNGVNKYFSIWQPTIDSVDGIGLLFHSGSGLFDQTPFAINASKHIFSVGITEVLRIADSNTILVKTTGVSGGGTIQVAGDINITGAFKINGVSVTAGGGSGAVSSVFGRAGAVVAQSGDYNISQISGISISSPTSGQVLTYNGSAWINAAPSGGGGGGVTLLSALSDVSVSGITNGQVLAYNSSTGKWTNQTISGGGAGSYIGGTGTTGYIPKFSSSTTLTNSIISEGSGSITVSGIIYASSGFETSDIRLKNIIENDGDLAKFTWKDGRDSLIHIGYIAQSIKDKYPNQVTKDGNGYYAVNYTEILVDKVARLEKRVAELEEKLDI